MKQLLCTLLAAACLLISGCAQTQEQVQRQAARPNVILMMADDLANEDLSCYGSTRIDTPYIDALASQGVQLGSFYAGNPVCSPSRMALLSGSYPARLGWRWGVMGYGFPPKSGMSPKVYTVAEAFRDAGYRTAISGKWHLGRKNMGPEEQGFESAYYIHMSNNQERDMYRDGELVQKDWDNRLLTETFAEEAIRVITEPSDQPFFLYVPWTAPHFPADPHPDWHGESGGDRSGKYTDVVEELDYRVGQILTALEAAGKADNTIVVFTSDNGRQPGQQGPDDEPPFSGGKWQSLEGGTRVPCILRYPGALPANKTNDQIVAAIDLFPTLAEACGIAFDLPEKAQKLDGVSTWANLTGQQSEPARNELLFWHGKGQATAFRQGDWKLHFNYGKKPPEDPELKDGPALYNLKTDPMEKNNLAAEHPEKVDALLKRAKELLIDVYSDQVPLGTWPGVELEKEPLEASDVWGPWID
ncbi:MAG TPA: sulfatase-like hydrolase/transferase [Opitutales bacterium]|nr:sulfatase-like hydrolase/transferase [Opitutales bacterium]